ncbi:hypothetical protein ACKWTF_008029 [Chironomus riparius]
MNDLRIRLQKSEMEKEEFKHQIRKLFDEKDSTQKHLEAISQAHENRITEMHCIIVELNKKLKIQHDTAIIEETEPEGSVSELSFQEGSVYNSEMEAANFEQRDESDLEQRDRIIMDKGSQNYKHFFELHNQVQQVNQQHKSSLLPTTNFSSQVQCMQEEILQLRAQVALLQSELACREYTFDKVKVTDDRDRKYDNEWKNEDENDKSNYTSDDLCETADIFDVIKQQESQSITSSFPPDQLQEFSQLSISRIATNQMQINDINVLKATHNQLVEAPIPKVAERVKLKRTTDDNFISTNELTDKDIFTTEVAEHLVSQFMHPERDVSTIQDLQNEVFRLQRRVEHLKLQNSVLVLTLSESKQHCDHLYLLCGKYESNAVALQQALNCNDRAIEAYDVMLALLESKLAIQDDVEFGEQNRKAAESVAHSLLDRLRNENSFYGKSTAPWQEAVIINPENENTPWTEEHDKMLRNQVSKLKGQRAFIQNTVVILESPFNLNDAINTKIELSPTKSRSRSRQKNMDIEQALLLQELMSLREELCDLKFQAEQSEKEKLSAHEKLKSLQAALVQLQSQLNESENKPRDRISYSEAEYNASIERELLEALSRECRLKARLQGLAGSLETATRGTAIHSSTKQNTVSELKQANLS